MRGADEPPTGDGGPSPGGDPSGDGPRIVWPSIDWSRLGRALRLSTRVVVVVVVVSVALGTAAFAVGSFYSQYGAVRNAPNARAWAGLTPRFAGQTICTSCHAPEARAQDASIHAAVSCEGCHGPAAAHSVSTVAAVAERLIDPTSEVCVTCHAATPGRSTLFPRVDPAAHYAGGACLRCHGPHSVEAVRPPTVSHPLADLPECTTCHAPDGLKEVPSGHEVVSDAVCLSCHGRVANGKT